MWNDTPAAKSLGLRYPIIQGPFGGGLSSVLLAAEVSNAGGLGSFGAHHLAPSKIQALTSELRRATDKPFALNLWVSNYDAGSLDMSRSSYEKYAKLFQPFYDDLGVEMPSYAEKYTESFDAQAEALLEARPPVFSFVFGIPSPKIMSECRRLGIVTLGAATNIEEAIAIEAAGTDLVLATGFEAGGHRVSFLRRSEDSLFGTFALVPQVADRVKIPVIAAGGIADARGIAAALALGAQGVQMGTAFLACEESAIGVMHRDMLFSEQARYTVLSRAYTGRLARFIPNAFIDGWKTPALPFPIQSWFTDPLKKAAAAQSVSAYASLYAGQGAPLLRHRKVAELMKSLVSDMERSTTQNHPQPTTEGDYQ